MTAFGIAKAVVRLIGTRMYAALAPFFLNRDRRYRQFEIGDFTYGKPIVHSWGEGTTLRIGRFCSITQDAVINLGGEHRLDWVTTYPFNPIFPDAKTFLGHPRSKGDVIIGNDVWISTQAMILSGVTIGDGAVVAARSVVTKNVPAYAIVAGNPARVVRFRFDQATIAALVRIAWWDWPIEDVKAAWPLLMNNDIARFVARYDPLPTTNEP